MLLELNRIDVPPGQKVLLHEVSWEEFETILEELGEHRVARLAYDNGIVEMMTPLLEHEYAKELIGDLIKALLEELNIEFATLGSTMFKNQTMVKGIEPDQCFYIRNESAIRGKTHLDLRVDPPPDLVLEVDTTSRTHLSIYEALGVPELWQYSKGQLRVYALLSGKYIESPTSPTFPGIPIGEAIPQYLELSQLDGRNKTIRAFRQWIAMRQ